MYAVVTQLPDKSWRLVGDIFVGFDDSVEAEKFAKNAGATGNKTKLIDLSGLVVEDSVPAPVVVTKVTLPPLTPPAK